MLIRAPILKDLQQILHIQNEFSATHWDESQIREQIKVQHPASAVLEDNNEVLGFVFVHSVGDDFEIGSTAVKKNQQRKGYGKLLLEHAIGVGKRENAACLLLEVSVNNPRALNLYKSCGFVPGRIRKSYYKDGSDALEMALKIIT